MVTAQLKLIGVIVLLGGYSLFASYRWLSNDLRNEAECDTSRLEAQIATLKATNLELEQKAAKALALQERQVEAGNEAREETRETFVEIKESVREVRVPYCPGSFEPRVRDAFAKAVAAANESGLPAASDP